MPSQYKDALGFRSTLHESLQDVSRILHPVERYWKTMGLVAPTWARTRCVGLWTPTGTSDNFYAKSSERDNFWNRFELSRFPAVLDDEYDKDGFLIGGRSSWPEQFPFEHWQHEQQANPYGFKIEYQCDDTPSVDDRSLIRVSDLFYESLDTSNLVATLDPSGGGDETVVAIGGLHRDSKGCRLHVKEISGWKNMTVEQMHNNVLDRLSANLVERIKIEENYPAAASIKKLAVERGQPLIVETFHAKGSKAQRLLMRLPTFLHGGGVTFDKRVLEDKDTLAQMASLRAGKNLPRFKDRLDCLEMLCTAHEQFIQGVGPNGNEPFRRYKMR